MEEVGLDFEYVLPKFLSPTFKLNANPKSRFLFVSIQSDVLDLSYPLGRALRVSISFHAKKLLSFLAFLRILYIEFQ